MRSVRVRSADTVFVFINFAVFTASMLLALVFGAGVYSAIANGSAEGRDTMSCVSYIRTKARAGDTEGSIYTGEFCGLSALYIREVYNDTTYNTAIYLYDGWVRELFSEEGLELAPGDGLPVVRADALAFERLENGIIKINADSESLFIYPRSKEKDMAGNGEW